MLGTVCLSCCRRSLLEPVQTCYTRSLDNGTAASLLHKIIDQLIGENGDVGLSLDQIGKLLALGLDFDRDGDAAQLNKLALSQPKLEESSVCDKGSLFKATTGLLVEMDPVLQPHEDKSNKRANETHLDVPSVLKEES